MKVRMGFVSNSSSTSFCICGTYFENEKLNELYEKKEIEKNWDSGCELAKLADLEYEGDQGDYGGYMGLGPEKIGDDETGKQFKERVLAGLQKVGFDVKLEDIGYHTEGWYDG
jgi:hypothetical protein